MSADRIFTVVMIGVVLTFIAIASWASDEDEDDAEEPTPSSAPQIPAIKLNRSELAARLDDAKVFLWEKGELKKGNEIAHVQASIIRMEAALAAERERAQRVTEAIEEGK